MKETLIRFQLDIQFFADEDPNPQPQPEEINLAEEVAKIKNGMVPKESYEALKKNYLETVRRIASGEDTSSDGQPDDTDNTPGKPKTRDPKTIAAEFMGGQELTNLDYVKHALELREASLERGMPDPFMPNDKNYSWNETDQAEADNVAKVLQGLVDKSNGDPAVFRGLLDSVLVSVQIPKPRTGSRN